MSSATLYITLNLSHSISFLSPLSFLFPNSRDPLSPIIFSVFFFPSRLLCSASPSSSPANQRRPSDGDDELGAAATERGRRGEATGDWVDRGSRGERRNRGERNRKETARSVDFRRSEHRSTKARSLWMVKGLTSLISSLD
ncbi:hypothetical protein Dimus_038919 [Dionaea muscipula]